MESWTPGERWRYGARQSAGLGAMAAVFEAAATAVTERDVFGLGERLIDAVALLAVLSVCAVGLGLLAGLVHPLRRDAPGYRTVALQLGLVAMGLSGLYFWPWSWRLWGQERAGAAIMIGLLPFGTAFTFGWNARFFLARKELGRPVVSWLAVVMPLSLAGVLLASLGASLRDTGGTYGVAGDPNVVMITIDGLGVDSLDAGATPAFDALAADGTTFRNAISPAPASVPAHGALLTGLHPLRHGAISDLRALSTFRRTVAERMASEGFATAGFASSAAVSDVGLEQGFLAFDDALAPPGARWRWLGEALPEAWVRRAGSVTVDRFAQWLGGHDDVPFLAWIQLEVTSEQSVSEVDALVGRVRSLLEEHRLGSRTLVLVAGTHGGLADAPRSGLSDAVVRVPLWMVAPGRPRVPEVSVQVRLVDVPMTMLAWAALDRNDEAEGIELLGFLDGRRSQGISTSLLGHEDDGRSLIGLRQDAVKYILDPSIDDERLYDLTHDPAEQDNLILEQAETADQARSMLMPELVALRQREGQPDLGARRESVLRALGIHR